MRQGTRSANREKKSEKMGKLDIKPGDQYVKSGMPPTYWTVDRLLDFPNTPQHVRLVRRRDETSHTRVITIAVSALMDRRNYKPVAA